MPISDNQIDFCDSTGAHILDQATPPIFVFFGTGPQCQDLLVPFQVHAKCRQDDGRVRLGFVPNRKMDQRPT
jgi:hypothetical protein